MAEAETGTFKQILAEPLNGLTLSRKRTANVVRGFGRFFVTRLCDRVC